MYLLFEVRVSFFKSALLYRLVMLPMVWGMASNGGRLSWSGSMRTSPSDGRMALTTRVSWYPGRIVVSCWAVKGTSSISVYSASLGGKLCSQALHVLTWVVTILCWISVMGLSMSGLNFSNWSLCLVPWHGMSGSWQLGGRSMTIFSRLSI